MRKLYIWLSLLLGAVLFALVLVHISWHDAIAVILNANPQYLAIYLAASIIIRLLLSLRWHIILKAKDMYVPYWRNVCYRTAGFAVSFVTPGPRVAGEVMTAGLVVRHNKKVRFSQALSTIAIDRSVELQTFATLFFLGVFILAALGDIPSGIRYLLLTVSIALLALITLFVLNIMKGKPFITNLLVKINKNKKFQREVGHFERTLVSFYKEDKIDFIKSHLVSSLAWLVSIIEYKYLLLMLGFDVPLYGIFIVYSFVGLAYVLPIPLAIGALEGGQAAAFSILGLNAAGGLILAFVTRLRDMAITIIGFMILLYYGIAPSTAAKTVRN